MEWQPIEIYDKMKVKPKHAVFYFKEEQMGRMTLGGHLEGKRNFGRRECTHFIALPEPPQAKGE